MEEVRDRRTGLGTRPFVLKISSTIYAGLPKPLKGGTSEPSATGVKLNEVGIDLASLTEPG